MDNNHDHIDEIFKSRFEGLKDHSIDPSEQWAQFEQMMAANTAAGAGAGVSGSSVAGVSSWAMAASMASLVAVSTMVSGDAGSESIVDVYNVATTESILQTENSSMEDAATSSSEASVESATLSGAFGRSDVASAEVGTSLPNTSNLAVEQQALVDASAGSASSASPATKSQAIIPPTSVNRTLGSSEGPAERSIATAFADPAEVASKEIWEATETVSSVSEASRRSEDLNLMAARGLTSEASGLAQHEAVEFVSRDSKRWKHRTFIELRAGLRMGPGERNTNVPSDLFVNPYATVGAGMRLSNTVSASLGVGYTRRAGNSLERKQEYDLSNLFNFVGNTYSTDPNEIPEALDIRQSIIATTTDWVQIPFSVQLQTGERVFAYVGGYAEYMLRVTNETFLVSNETQYVSVSTSQVDQNPFIGLQRFRYGAMVGGSYQIQDRLFADARAMVSLNPALRNEAGYTVEKKPNRGFDFQIGISYHL